MITNLREQDNYREKLWYEYQLLVLVTEGPDANGTIW